jgi:Tfp pilus assembly protein PilV
MRQREHQSGFGTVEILLVVLVVAVLSVTGLVLYHRHKPSNAKNSAATSQTQTTSTQSQSTITTQTQQAATDYLTIKEWGIKMPLSNTIGDAYYVVATNSTGTMWLGRTALNTGDCKASQANTTTSEITAIGALVRVAPTDIDPVQGKPYSQLYPGVTIGNYFYGYMSGIKGKTCASSSVLQSTDAAFATAAKNIVPVSN